MRKLKRWIRNALAEWRIRARRDEAAAELAAALKIPAPVLVSKGAMGHDSNYLVLVDGSPFGVLRLINPYKSRRPPQGMPFMLEEPEKRLTRELSILHAGAHCHLTPRPLWHAPDALLVSWLPMRPLQERIAGPLFWEHMALAARRIRDLHAAGITHMDMSPANILIGEGDRIAFVDFEYAPAPGITPAQQRLYDHLRLIESAYKFMPPGAESRALWRAEFAAAMDPDMRAANLRPLAPALGRVFSDAELRKELSPLIARLPG